MEQSIGVSLVLGLFVSVTNEALTRFYLTRFLRREWSSLRSIALLLIVGFYLLKYSVLGLGLYGLFVATQLNLAAFALGILIYQTFRVGWMIFASHTFSGHQTT